MPDVADSCAIAERIRGLIGRRDRRGLEVVAQRLGVSEVALRMTIDELAPHAVLDVLVAVVRVYGVDPAWLLTGVYDAATHRAALDEDGVTRIGLAKLLMAQSGAAQRGPDPVDQWVEAAEKIR